MVLKAILHRRELQLLLLYSFNGCMIHFPEKVQRVRESVSKYCAYPRFLHRISSVIICFFTETYCKGGTQPLQIKQRSVCLSQDAVFNLFVWIYPPQHTQMLRSWCGEQKGSYYRKIQAEVRNRIVQKLEEVSHNAWVILMPCRQWIIFHVIRLKGNVQQIRQI